MKFTQKEIADQIESVANRATGVASANSGAGAPVTPASIFAGDAQTKPAVAARCGVAGVDKGKAPNPGAEERAKHVALEFSRWAHERVKDIGLVQEVSPLPPAAELFTLGGQSALVAAAELAFQKRYALRLSPSFMWSVMLVGFGDYINRMGFGGLLGGLFGSTVPGAAASMLDGGGGARATHAEQAVKFKPNSADGVAWRELLPTFSAEVLGSVQNNDLLRVHLGTESAVDAAARGVIVADAAHQFASYSSAADAGAASGAAKPQHGIHSVVLEGSKGDWLAVRNWAVSLAKAIYDEADLASQKQVYKPGKKTDTPYYYDSDDDDYWDETLYVSPTLARVHIDEWMRSMTLALDKFVDACDGIVDKRFWSRFYESSAAKKYDEATDDGVHSNGGRCVDGWVLAFVPFLREMLDDWRGGMAAQFNYRMVDLYWYHQYGDLEFFKESRVGMRDLPDGASKMVRTLRSGGASGKASRVAYVAGPGVVELDAGESAVSPRLAWAVFLANDEGGDGAKNDDSVDV